jgi:hypothetical protein
MSSSRERSPYCDVTHAHRNHQQRAEKCVRRRRWNPGQTADRSDNEGERKSQYQPHINSLQRCSFSPLM